MTLKEAVDLSGLSRRKAGDLCGVGKASAVRGINGEGWPQGRSGPARTALEEELSARGIAVNKIDWDAAMWEKRKTNSRLDVRRVSELGEQETEVELMQMDREVLRLFGLRRNPFEGDIEADADVWKFHGWQRVEDAIRDCIEERGFLSVMAHSGAGKTTIMEGIEAEMMAREDVVWSKPHLMDRDRLNADHLIHALVGDIAGDGEKVRASMEARSRQLVRLLSASYLAGKKVVLYIDDAHFCRPSVLRHLKRYYEAKVGRFRLLAIILVGLPELEAKLATFAEIGNRIRVVEVPQCPVDEYLSFKLSRVGATPLDLFDEQGWTAFQDRFRATARAKPVGRPLVINATCIRAMAALYRSGATAGEKIGREIVDTLPGAMRRLG